MVAYAERYQSKTPLAACQEQLIAKFCVMIVPFAFPFMHLQSRKSESVFTSLKQRVTSDRNLMKSVNAVYYFDVTRDGETVAQWSQY